MNNPVDGGVITGRHGHAAVADRRLTTASPLDTDHPALEVQLAYRQLKQLSSGKHSRTAQPICNSVTQEAQLMLTNPRDAFTPCMVSY